jgi:hypothetical protein
MRDFHRNLSFSLMLSKEERTMCRTQASEAFFERATESIPDRVNESVGSASIYHFAHCCIHREI